MDIDISSAKGISVVICAHRNDRWDDIGEVLTSLRAQTTQAREIILVIDHNPELMAQAVETLQDVKVVHNTTSPGASGARNAGVALASSAIIAFFDDDVVVAPDWVEKTTQIYESESDLIGVVGFVGLLWQCERPRWFPPEFNWVVGGSYVGMPEVPTPVRNGWAGNLSLRRDIFMKIGGFREGFGKTGSVSSPEDTELCIRAGQQEPGKMWLFRPDVIVRHKVPPERATWKFFLYRCYREGVGKAQLSSLVGDAGTKDERSYTRQILPRAVWRNLRAALRGDLSGLLRIGAILVGFAVTAFGFVAGWLPLIGAKRDPAWVKADE